MAEIVLGHQLLQGLAGFGVLAPGKVAFADLELGAVDAVIGAAFPLQLFEGAYCQLVLAEFVMGPTHFVQGLVHVVARGKALDQIPGLSDDIFVVPGAEVGFDQPVLGEYLDFQKVGRLPRLFEELGGFLEVLLGVLPVRFCLGFVSRARRLVQFDDGQIAVGIG